MKTSIIRQIGLVLGTTFAIATSYGQSQFVAFEQVKNPIPEYRENSEGNSTLTDPVVSSKTLSAFAAMFKGASDARWFEVDGRLMAKFERDGRQSTALFNKNGKHIYTITYGTEKDLPAEARRLIKMTYFDFEITHVTEVNSLGKTAWIANVEDQDKLITVKVVDDQIEEMKNYRKAK